MDEYEIQYGDSKFDAYQKELNLKEKAHKTFFKFHKKTFKPEIL
jgi:hypothetical protein